MDKNDFNVYPLKEDKPKKPERELPDIFPTGSFNSVIVGSSQTGKTVCATSMFCRENMYGERDNGKDKYFENIIIISSTLGSDESIEPIIERADGVYDHYDNRIVTDIMDFCRERRESGDDAKTLILADDIISIVKPSDALSRAFSNCRHFNVSICCLLQAIRGTLSPSARSNIHFWVCYRLHNEKEREKLYEELSFLDSCDEVKLMYEYCVNEPYQFMAVNAKDLIVYKNFTEPLWRRYNEDGTYADSFSVQRGINIKDKSSKKLNNVRPGEVNEFEETPQKKGKKDKKDAS